MTNSKDEVADKLKILQKWFEENPNLPQKIELFVLRRFLKCMHYDLDETKKIIELNYSIRNKNANIFLDRNMEDEPTAQSLTTSDLLILPGLTPERQKLILFRMVDLDPATRNSVEESKIFFMMADARFTMPDVEPESPNTVDTRTNGNVENEEEHGHEKDEHEDKQQENAADESSNTYDDDDIADGDIQIVDINGYTMRHVARVSIFVLRVYMRFLQEAYPSRLRSMHLINCPSILDKMIVVLKPFIREEVFRMMKFHTDGLESLYEQVPRDLLPEEYGGKAGKIADIRAKCLQLLRDKSNYLSDEKYWKVTATPGRSRWSWF